MKGNALYAQSGGVTSVINASAFGVIKTAIQSSVIHRVFGAVNGINGVLSDELISVESQDPVQIARIPFTPGAIFGSCRKKLTERDDFARLFQTFQRYDIGFFFYNGGNDSMDTASKIASHAQEIGYPLQVVGIPKTVDNDLEGTDHCPGYGSAAKYTAVSVMEATRDVRSMSADSTQVFIFESMGRHAGWLTAAASLAFPPETDRPLILLFPEEPFNETRFIHRLETAVESHGYCTVVVSEGLKTEEGAFLSASSSLDAFGNVQLGKVSYTLESIIKTRLSRKVHVCIPDYLQRSSRHLSSYIDWREAIDVGHAAVDFAENQSCPGLMVTIDRTNNQPYQVRYRTIPLEQVANKTKIFPERYRIPGEMMVSESFKEYALPLIQGEAPNLWMEGLPLHAKLSLTFDG